MLAMSCPNAKLKVVALALAWWHHPSSYMADFRGDIQ